MENQQTASLIYHILNEKGYIVELVGNIGRAALSLDDYDKKESLCFRDFIFSIRPSK